MGKEFIVPVGSVIKEYLDEYDITQKELSYRLGMSEKQISKLMTAKSRLTEDVAIRLETVVPNLKADYLLKYESKYREYLTRQKNDEMLAKMNLQELSERFCFQEVFEGCQYDILTQAKEMLRILKISSFENFDSTYDNLLVNFMEDGGRKEAIAVWLGLCEEEIDIQNDDLTDVEYSPTKFKTILPLIRTLARSADLSSLTKNCRKLCNEQGVYLVVQKPVKNSKVRGALTTYKGHPAIYLSGRFKTHDHVWFALAHELGHLVLHYEQKSLIVSYEDEDDMNRSEQEANQYARDFFINQDDWNMFVQNTTDITEGKIRIFAKRMKVHPGIVVARLQHDGIMERNMFNQLKVKIDFDDLNLELI